MPIQTPQADLPAGLRGGADTWDQSQASALLDADWFEQAASPVIGSLNTAETGSDSFAASGALSSGIAGTLAATETGADTASASGDVFIGGTLSATEFGGDAAALAGDVFVSGGLSASEVGADTATASGDVVVAGSLSADEVGQDTAALSGNVPVQGDLAVTESGQDVFAGSSAGSSSGDMAAVESGADGFAADGSASSGAANRAGFEMGGRVYIKRGRKIHIFDTVEDADAWEAAEAAAQEATAKAKTRTAKRRIVRKVETAIEHEVLRLDLLDALVARLKLKFNFPDIEARQDWAEYVRIAMLARELEDEEEIESLLLLM